MFGALELVVTEMTVLAIGCLLLIRYYKGNMVTIDVTVSVYISWALGFVGVLLLPYDLSVALINREQSYTLLNTWRITYWSTFFLAWGLLPIQMEYHGSGHFTFRNKLKEALMKLILSGVVAAAAGTVYFIVMLFSGSGSLYQIIGFSMAMSNTYGVLLITVLMGNGLVGIPKRLWLMADSDKELKRLYISAGPIEEEYQEARYELEDTEIEVRRVVEYVDKAGASSQIFKEIGSNAYTLKAIVSNFNFSSRSTIRSTARSSADRTPLIGYTDKDVVNLHARLIKAQLKARSAERRWQILISQAKKSLVLQKESPASEDLEARWCTMQIDQSAVDKGGSSSFGLNMERFSCCVGYCGSFLAAVRLFWLSHCRSLFLRAAAIVCGVASCLILWSEMLMASDLHSPMALMMGDPQNLNPIVVQGVSFLFLSYMSICTYWTLFRINIGWEYKLQGPQQSPPSSLIFNAEYFSRLQFSVGYNFLLCLNLPDSNKTAFDALMQNMDTVPVFGASFTVYVPFVMVIVALMTLFDGLPRLLKLIGVETEDSPALSACSCLWASKDGLLAVEDEEKIRLGKSIITSEIKHGENNFHSNNNSGKKAVAVSVPYDIPGIGGGDRGIRSETTASSGTPMPPPRLGRSYMNLSREEKDEDDDVDDSIDFNKYISRSSALSPSRSEESDSFEESSPLHHTLFSHLSGSAMRENFSSSHSKVAARPNVNLNRPSAASAFAMDRFGGQQKGKDFQLNDADSEPINRGRYSDL